MLAIDLTSIANITTWCGLAISGVLLSFSVVFAYFERQLRMDLLAQAKERSTESLRLVDKNLNAAAPALKEARLTAGEVMEGWARAASQPSMAARLLIAGLTALGLAAGISVTTTIFNPSQASRNGVTTTRPTSSAPSSITSRQGGDYGVM